MTGSIGYVYKLSMKNVRPQPSARNKMMDLLARRNHSEKEIRQKLKNRFPPEEIEQAIEYGKTHRWLPADEEQKSVLSNQLCLELGRRGKGIRYINQKLQQKGLPLLKGNPVEELEKATQLAETKFSRIKWDDPRAQARVGRFLAARGFDLEIVRKVIYGKK